MTYSLLASRAVIGAAAVALIALAALHILKPDVHPSRTPWLVGVGATMISITDVFSQAVPGINRIVIDRTGLTGTFDIDLRWTLDSPVLFGGQVIPPFDGNAPTVFTAIQEQLGLKLESTRAPVDVLVIDRAEQPTAD